MESSYTVLGCCIIGVKIFLSKNELVHNYLKPLAKIHILKPKIA
jgi:hypothetical protein